MGNVDNTIASHADFDNGKAAVATYINSCQNCVTSIDNIINNLTATGAGFNGDAADGFKTFYTAIRPALAEQLTEDPDSLMKSISAMLDSIEKALNLTMDPNLKAANEEATPAIKK